jgi:hypothetical protein
MEWVGQQTPTTPPPPHTHRLSGGIFNSLSLILQLHDGLVAKMTSKTQNCCLKFNNHEEYFKKLKSSISVLCFILFMQVFHQNEVFRDYSIKVSEFEVMCWCIQDGIKSPHKKGGFWGMIFKIHNQNIYFNYYYGSQKHQ